MNKVEEILKIADIHAEKIIKATKSVVHLFPMNAPTVSNLEDQDMLWIELLVSRFGKLQDLLGAKLIDAFFEVTQEDISTLTMLDKLNKLERLEVIESVELWKEMRLARNYVAHEYPENPELIAEYLNMIFTLSPKLITILENIRKKISTSM